MFEVECEIESVPTEILKRSEDDISVWWIQDQELRQPKLEMECKIYPASISVDARGAAYNTMAQCYRRRLTSLKSWNFTT